MKDLFCENANFEEIHSAMARKPEGHIPSITFKLPSSYGADHIVSIPADLLSGHRVTLSLSIICPTTEERPRIRIHPNAFGTSRNYASSFYMAGCNLKHFDFGFLSGFKNLYKMTFKDILGFHQSLHTLPALPSLCRLEFNNCLDLRLWVDFPPRTFRGFRSLTLKNNSLDDFQMEHNLKWAVNTSSKTLEFLDISYNNLTRIPREIAEFQCLTELFLCIDPSSGQPPKSRIPVIHSGAFYFSSSLHSEDPQQLHAESCGIEDIESGAFLGTNFGKLYF